MLKTIVLGTAVTVLVGLSVLSTGQADAAFSKYNQTTQQSAANPNVPGATGKTIVPGDPSTIAGVATALRAVPCCPMSNTGRAAT
jgi:hypothetical protein